MHQTHRKQRIEDSGDPSGPQGRHARPAQHTRSVTVILSWLTVSLLIMLISGCSQQPPSQNRQSVKVVVTSPLRTPVVEWDEYIGRIEAIEKVEVRARVGGHLASTHFDEGQLVQAGDLLCILDQRPFRIAVEQTEADVAGMQARTLEAQAQLAQAEAEVRSSRSLAELTRRMFERGQQLVQQNALAKEELETRETSFQQSTADVDVKIARVSLAKAAIVTVAADLQASKSRLAAARLNLEYTEVRAPVTGRVGHRAVTDGNLISGGTEQSTLLTTIVSLDPIHCDFDADEQAFLKYMRLAGEGALKNVRDSRLPAFVRLGDEQNTFPHRGHLDFLDNRLDRKTATIRGRAILPNPDHKLTPGLFAKVRVPGSGRHDAVLIPDSAVGTDQSEKYVLVVDNDQTIRRQKIEMGRRVRGLRIVHQGLDGTEQIVLRGLQRVAPGSVVSVTFEETVPVDDGLPDSADPLPERDWLKSYDKRPADVVRSTNGHTPNAARDEPLKSTTAVLEPSPHRSPVERMP